MMSFVVVIVTGIYCRIVPISFSEKMPIGLATYPQSRYPNQVKNNDEIEDAAALVNLGLSLVKSWCENQPG